MFEILKEPKVLLFNEKIEAQIPALLYCLYQIYCLFRGKFSAHKQLIPAWPIRSVCPRTIPNLYGTSPSSISSPNPNAMPTEDLELRIPALPVSGSQGHFRLGSYELPGFTVRFPGSIIQVTENFRSSFEELTFGFQETFRQVPTVLRSADEKYCTFSCMGISKLFSWDGRMSLAIKCDKLLQSIPRICIQLLERQGEISHCFILKMRIHYIFYLFFHVQIIILYLVFSCKQVFIFYPKTDLYSSKYVYKINTFYAFKYFSFVLFWKQYVSYFKN